ncbi:MAG: carboxypeptidase-like regulatory domain-containing protein [Candidatus Anstonellaceae archaeon]
MSRLWVALALFLLPLVHSYTLQIKVLVPPDTIAVGTNISLLHEGVEIASAKAGKDGTASFEVLPASYFVVLKRGGYPTAVHLLRIDKNMNITYILRDQLPYAGIWGRISGPADFSNSSITIYSEEKIVARYSHKKDGIPNKDGYFLISFLPEGQYRVVFEVQGFLPKEEVKKLSLSDFAELNLELEQPKQEAQAPKLALIVTSENKKHSLIAVQLLNGSRPLGGEKIQVETPSGQITIITSSNGTAYLNAAEAGTYVFSYMNLSSTLFIEEEKTEQESTSPAQNQSAIQQPPPSQEPKQLSSPSRSEEEPWGGGLLFAVLGAAAFLVVIAAVLFLLKRKPHHHKKHKR